VEFVCGLRAVSIARRDFETLTEAAALFSTHIWSSTADSQMAERDQGSAESTTSAIGRVAELQAERMLLSAEQRGPRKLVVQYLADRDLGFIKMLAQSSRRMTVWSLCWPAEADSHRWCSRRRPGRLVTWAR